MERSFSFPEGDRVEVPLEVAELRLWITAWFEHAVQAGFLQYGYVLDDATAKRLELYYHAGLTPREGAGVMFERLH